MATSKKKPAKKAKNKKRGRPQRIDYVPIRLAYVRSRKTIEDLAEEFRDQASLSAIRRKSALEDWPKQRSEFLDAAMERGLAVALEDRTEGAAAIIRLEYEASRFVMMRLRDLQKEAEEKELSVSEMRSLLSCLREASSLARLSLGLPTEIKASPADAADTYEAMIAKAEKDRGLDDPERNPEGI